MQSVAVLLLDLVFKAKGKKANGNDDNTPDLKKLMEWLRAMQRNDPVADRAYQVVRKIIKNSGSAFQEKTDVLLAEETNLDSGVQSSSRNDSHNDKLFEFRQGGTWTEEENLAITTANPGAFNFQYYQQPLNHISPEFTEAQYFWSAQDQFHFPTTFGNPFINSFDQGAPVINMADLWADPGLSSSMGDMSLLGTDPAAVAPPTGPPNDPFFFQQPPRPQ
jgi:hypothetical protein